MKNVFRYTDAGLYNVLVVQPEPFATDDHGERTFTIRNLPGLHRAIAVAIIGKNSLISGNEIRFLRTEMGLTQAELGRILHRENLTISRWERGTHDIDEMADILVRLLAKERLEISDAPTLEAMSELAVPRAGSQRAIWIDGTESGGYTPINESEVPAELRTGTYA